MGKHAGPSTLAAISTILVVAWWLKLVGIASEAPCLDPQSTLQSKSFTLMTAHQSQMEKCSFLLHLPDNITVPATPLRA